MTARGNRGQAIFHDDRDRGRLMMLLAGVIGRTGWKCLAYCLMGNHYHLLLQTPRPNLGDGMRRLNGRYAQEFNRRHKLGGHLFQGRYHSVPATRDEQVLEAVRYITLNPVRAGLCATAEEWPWSSHAALVRSSPPGLVAVDDTLSFFSPYGGDGSSRYRRFVEETNTFELAVAA